MTSLPKSKDWQEIKYSLILLLLYYKPIFILLDTQILAKVLIEMAIKYYKFLDFIVSN